MKKLRLLIAILIAVCLVGAGGFDSVWAAELSAGQEMKLFEEIQAALEQVYQGQYKIENQQWEVAGVEAEDEAVAVNVLLTADVTLLTDAYGMPYYQGLFELWKQAGAEQDVAKLVDMMEAYASEIHAIYYNIPLSESFEFSVQIPLENLQKARADSPLAGEIRYQGLAGLYPIDSLLLSEEASKALAGEAAQSYLAAGKIETVPYSQINAGYNRRSARRYALDEFYNPDHYGRYESNCANFVSYCLNDGGGLAKTSRWKPGQYDWIRTGYNRANGVTLHLTRNESFQNTDNRASVSAGAVVMWKDFSHVGLITYGDGTKLRFTAHTTYRQDFVLPAEEAVTFYQR